MNRIFPADMEHIARAAKHIAAGDLVAFPTETVYGLGGDAGNEQAVAGIFAAKGRPSFNPLIVHVAGLAAATEHADFSADAMILARSFWPGPLTLVLKRRAGCRLSLLVSAGMDSVALRVPAHPVARGLLAMSGRPIAGPSANPSGRISPTTASHVAEGLGDKVAMILDGGPCEIGLESTVVSLLEEVPQILRPGRIGAAELEAALGRPVAMAAQIGDVDSGLHGPGRLLSHYAPNAAMRLNAGDVRPGEALLAFGPGAPPAAQSRNLSPRGDLTEAAANLFAMLRELDASNAAGIAVMPIPETGLGLAINDRLRRAAAPR